MPRFTSSREKKLWLWALAVVMAIFASLFMGRPLAEQLRSQDIQAIFFLAGLLLVGAVILMHGLRSKPGRIEIVTLLGLTAVYAMLLFRLGAPERSHLIEYSVLAIFIHQALSERAKNTKVVPKPIVLAAGIAFLIGVIDEALQLFVPDRVFDPEDILFNGLAILLALGASSLLQWIRKKTTAHKRSD